jgi:hypothetical protein
MKHVFATGTTVVAGKEQVSAELDGEVVMLSLRNGEYFGLNGVGARIWSMIRQPCTVGDLCDLLLKEYTDVELDRCEREVVALLEEMAGAGLIEIVDRS